ncbi:unnamed protein product, partial [Ectocarpus sp. 8 AP-2014]
EQRLKERQAELERQKQAEKAAAILLSQSKNQVGYQVQERPEALDEEERRLQQESLAPVKGDDDTSEDSSMEEDSKSRAGDLSDPSPQVSPPQLKQLSSAVAVAVAPPQEAAAAAPPAAASTPARPEKSFLRKLTEKLEWFPQNEQQRREEGDAASGAAKTTSPEVKEESVGGTDAVPHDHKSQQQQAVEPGAAGPAATAGAPQVPPPPPAAAAAVETTNEDGVQEEQAVAQPAKDKDDQLAPTDVAWQTPGVSPQVPPPILDQLSQREGFESQRTPAPTAKPEPEPATSQPQQQQLPASSTADVPAKVSPQVSPPQLQQLSQAVGKVLHRQPSQEKPRLEEAEEKAEEKPKAKQRRPGRMRLLPSPHEMAKRRSASLQQRQQSTEPSPAAPAAQAPEKQEQQKRLLLQLPKPQASHEEVVPDAKTPQSKERVQAHAQQQRDQRAHDLPGPRSLEGEMQEAEPLRLPRPAPSPRAPQQQAVAGWMRMTPGRRRRRQRQEQPGDGRRSAADAEGAPGLKPPEQADEKEHSAASDVPAPQDEAEEAMAVATMPDLNRTPWAVGEAEAAEIARAATADALCAKEAEEQAARQRRRSGTADSGGEGEAGQEAHALGSGSVGSGSWLTVTDQDRVHAWLRGGVTVKKWTAGGTGTRKRRLRLAQAGTDTGSLAAQESQLVAPGGSSVATGGGGMAWSTWAQGGVTDSNGGSAGETLDGELGGWMLVLQSDKGKDVAHRLSNLREVSEDAVEKSVTLSFDDGGEGDRKMRLSFPTELPVANYLRQVQETRTQEEKIMRAAKTALVALETGANARAISAAARDTASRWTTHSSLEEIEEACLGGDVIETQPSLAVGAASHLKDSRPAREEIEGIVKGLTRFDHGLKPLPAIVLTTVEDIEQEAKRYHQGNVRRVLNVVKLVVVSRGAKEAAEFCRKLKYHTQVKAVMWERLPQSPVVKTSNVGFTGIKASVELEASNHVVEVEVR